MNAKRCKQLRAAARDNSIGKPNVAYEHVQVINTRTGQPRYIRRLKEGCTRWVYKALKNLRFSPKP